MSRKQLRAASTDDVGGLTSRDIAWAVCSGMWLFATSAFVFGLLAYLLFAIVFAAV